MTTIFELDSCKIFFGTLRETLSPWYAERQPSSVLVVTDNNTQQHSWPLLRDSLDLSADLPVAELQAGENAKNLVTAEALWKAMHELRLDRQSLVLTLGGGVVSDLAGFCAATYKRGIPCVHVPTTLLAATDAAIGGKTGLNFQQVKNVLGSFSNPEAVFVDPVFFKTLPVRELRSGLAEVVKHALIGDPVLWRLLTETDDLLAADWNKLLPPSIAVKVRVVQEDPLEKDLRRVLNFGHTIGHAVESYGLGLLERLTHGEAVAIGLVAESYLAWGDTERTRTVAGAVKRLFGHHAIAPEIFEVLWNTMQHDKKNERGAVRVAVPGEAPFSLQVLEPDRRQIEESLAFYNGLG